MKRHDLTDRQWSRLVALLPPQRPRTGRPNHDHRRIINGILWRLKTGVPWRDLPERYGPWETVYSRFRRWQRAGIWDRVLAALQAEADAAGRLDWDLAAGAIGGGRAPRRSATVGAASAPRSISARRVAASQWPSS
jgi:transposase